MWVHFTNLPFVIDVKMLLNLIYKITFIAVKKKKKKINFCSCMLLCALVLQGPLAGRCMVCLGFVSQLWRLPGVFKIWAVQYDSSWRPPQPRLHRLDWATQVWLQWFQSVTSCSFVVQHSENLCHRALFFFCLVGAALTGKRISSYWDEKLQFLWLMVWKSASVCNYVTVGITK